MLYTYYVFNLCFRSREMSTYIDVCQLVMRPGGYYGNHKNEKTKEKIKKVQQVHLRVHLLIR